ncbi:MAG: chromate transporter [Bacillota bacterium]|nr:chromate transporter [Bacillota bacterium]
MVPLIRREVVDRRGWMTDEEFLDALAVAQSAPGPIAVSTAVFIGHRVAGPAGLMAAAAGATLPSFLAILLVASFFLRLEANPWVARFFAGVRPAVLALIALAAWELASAALRDRPSLALALAGVVLLLAFHAHPALALVGGLAAGLLFFRRAAGERPAETGDGADGAGEGRP